MLATGAHLAAAEPAITMNGTCHTATAEDACFVHVQWARGRDESEARAKEAA